MPISVVIRTANNRAGLDSPSSHPTRKHRGSIIDVVPRDIGDGQRTGTSPDHKIIKINVAPGSSVAQEWIDMMLPALDPVEVDEFGNPVVLRSRAYRIAFKHLSGPLKASLLDTATIRDVTKLNKYPYE